MPKNPDRSSKGGDVEGEAPIDTSDTVGSPKIMVAKASFDPGYMDDALTNSLTDAGTDISKADLITGYCGYGQAIGE